MLDKNTNAGHFLTTVGYLFSKYVHCEISALLCFLNGFGIKLLGHQLYNHCVAYQMVQNYYLISRIIVNILHTFQQV